MSDTPVHTLEQCLRWAGGRLARAGLHFGHGTDNAEDEAAWLVLHALGEPPERAPADPRRPLTAAEVAAVEALVGRRIRERRPAAYLTRRAWFAGLEFYVDERVLIPRSPLAEPILAGFEPWLGGRRPRRVLDLCCGSACIAVACAKAFAEAEIDASDLSAPALAVARINLERHGLQGRVRLWQSDLFAALPARRYDLILCNPPYVGEDEMARLPAEYAHEPDLALRAADQGLELVNRILFEAGHFLAPAGLLVVEVGNTAPWVAECYPDLPVHWLEFARGGAGVFLVTAEDLAEWVGSADPAVS